MSFITEKGKLFYRYTIERKVGRDIKVSKKKRMVFRGGSLTKTFRKQLAKDIKRGFNPVLPTRILEFLTENNKIINEVTGRIVNNTTKNRKNILDMPYPPSASIEGNIYPEGDFYDELVKDKYKGKFVIITDGS